MKRLTIWDEQGRELVCSPVEPDHPLLDTREGFRCKIMTTDGDRGHSHVYYDQRPFTVSGHGRGRASIFYQNSTWWRSHVHLKGWSFNFTPPRKRVLEQELTALAARILVVNNELNSL